ncbi:MAG: hypothetical protein IJK71_03490 [Clostridia bacterium]|nr:hypothetical protein [Clostridia bacterium]
MKKTGLIVICAVLALVIAIPVLAANYNDNYNCSSNCTKNRKVGYNTATFYFEKGGLFSGDSIAFARQSCDSHSDKMTVNESITTSDNQTKTKKCQNYAACQTGSPLIVNLVKSKTQLTGNLWKAAKKTYTKFTDDYLEVNTWTINGSK